MTENPSAHHYPDGVDPDRAPTDPDSLRTTNDEFLEALEQRVGLPLTPPERQRAKEVAQETERLRLNMRTKETGSERPSDVFPRTELGDKQWSKLDSETRDLFRVARQLFHNIKKRFSEKHGGDELIQLSTELHDVQQRLQIDFDTYMTGKSVPEMFSRAVDSAMTRLNDIDLRLSKHR